MNIRSIFRTLRVQWARFWLGLGGFGFFGRRAMWLASLGAPPYIARQSLARMRKGKSYVGIDATIYHRDFRLGDNGFIDDGAVVYQHHDGGKLRMGAEAIMHRGVTFQQGHGADIVIGDRTSFLPYTMLSAFVASIRIGNDVQIAGQCAIYSYNHAMALGTPIAKQELVAKGEIIIEDDVWIGAQVTILSGVRIGKGAVVGAGAVVTSDIPENAIAVGNPARVVGSRENL